MENEENVVLTLVKSMNEIAHANVRIIEKMNETSEQVTALGDLLARTQEGMQTATSLLVMALLKQKAIDRRQLAADFSSLVDGAFGEQARIPAPVLNLRAALSHAVGNGESR